MGYNIADNLLYAAFTSARPCQILRIAGNGDAVSLGTIDVTGWASVNAGDVDENSQYWISDSGKSWMQIDMKPNSTNYGQSVRTGVAEPGNSLRVIDWAYVPGRGNFLWGLGYASANPNATHLMQFNRTSGAWNNLANLGDIAGISTSARNAWGAVYASDDGFLFGSENNSGHIYKFSLVPVNGAYPAPVKISNGPTSSGNDGARCINAANVA